MENKNKYLVLIIAIFFLTALGLFFYFKGKVTVDISSPEGKAESGVLPEEEITGAANEPWENYFIECDNKSTPSPFPFRKICRAPNINSLTYANSQDSLYILNQAMSFVEPKTYPKGSYASYADGGESYYHNQFLDFLGGGTTPRDILNFNQFDFSGTISNTSGMPAQQIEFDKGASWKFFIKNVVAKNILANKGKKEAYVQIGNEVDNGWVSYNLRRWMKDRKKQNTAWEPFNTITAGQNITSAEKSKYFTVSDWSNRDSDSSWPWNSKNEHDNAIIPYYVEYYLAPTVEAFRQSETSDYKFRLMLGSIAGAYKWESRQWLKDLLGYTIKGTYLDGSSNLKGKKVAEVVDYISLQYLACHDDVTFSDGSTTKNWRNALFDVNSWIKDYPNIKEIWATEEVGFDFTPANDVFGAKAFARYMRWNADHSGKPVRVSFWPGPEGKSGANKAPVILGRETYFQDGKNNILFGTGGKLNKAFSSYLKSAGGGIENKSEAYIYKLEDPAMTSKKKTAIFVFPKPGQTVSLKNDIASLYFKDFVPEVKPKFKGKLFVFQNGTSSSFPVMASFLANDGNLKNYEIKFFESSLETPLGSKDITLDRKSAMLILLNTDWVPK
jgi:hypothetical protein